jgi:probable phosphoglycerate mutase
VATTSEDPPAVPATYRQSSFPAIPGAVDILLIRHGESQEYTPGIPFPLMDGHGDPPLAPNGHEQAKLLADRLASAPIDAIYVTTLRRTAQTAAPLAERLGLTPAVEPDLREVHLGEWEGGEYRQRVAERDPLVMEAFTQERWDVIPGAESPATVSARVRGAIERIARAHREQLVAVFAHGGVIGEVLAQASGSRPFAFVASDNASISRLIVTDERWFVRAFNDTAHLGHPA